MPFTVDLIYSKPIKNAYLFEEKIHSKYKDRFVQNEWFNLLEENIKEIINDCESWQGL